MYAFVMDVQRKFIETTLIFYVMLIHQNYMVMQVFNFSNPFYYILNFISL
jgi:hypothetical protein